MGHSVLHRRTSGTTRAAGRLEETAARAWNVLNEGKPFTVVAGLALILATGAPAAGLVAAIPLFVAWWRHPYPLHLRAVLVGVAAAVVVLAGGVPAGAAALAVGSYLLFTVVLWGTVYYHLRIGAPLTNFWRFWRLVVENPDPTSGNLIEQLPKLLALLAVAHGTNHRTPAILLAAGVAVLAVGEVVQRRFITWVPGWATGNRRADRRPSDPGPAHCGPPSRKTLLIVIDGCRADRLAEADTPFLDRLAAEGAAFSQCFTVYPARTVTCFSSMLTGAPPAVHGMRSNFVPSLGVKCESIFDLVPGSSMVGIAHLVDAFGDKVRSVTAVMPNGEIDAALCSRARQVVEEEDPDLLVVQTLSVDQTGHFRGSFYDEYLQQIEATDRELEALVDWLAERWGGLDGVTIGVLSDHGQGRGIGGHGHWSPTERLVPCIWWGHGVTPAPPHTEPVTIMDVAPTLAHRVGVRAPDRSVGRCLLCPPAAEEGLPEGPVAVVLPVHNEAATVAGVIRRTPSEVAGRPVEMVVVDDGSTDGSGDVARAAGATVITHSANAGLGAAIRTGFGAAAGMGASAVVFLDADGEYDPADIPALIEPIGAGRADYVVGSRFRGDIAAMLPHRRVGNHLLTAVVRACTGLRVTDGQSGMRALSARAMGVAGIAHDYNYAQVLTIDLVRKGFRYAEVPIHYRRRQVGQSFVTPVRYLRAVTPAMARSLRVR